MTKKYFITMILAIIVAFFVISCATSNEDVSAGNDTSTVGNTTTVASTTPQVTTTAQTTPVITTTPTTTTSKTPDITTTTPVTTSPTPVNIYVQMDFDYYSNLEGDKIVEIYKDNGCPDVLLPSGVKGKVSVGELEKIKTFFGDLNTLRFIPVAYEYYDYFDASKISLHMVLEANSAPTLSNVSEEERKLLPDSFIGDAMKLTTAQIKELYKKYLGIDFDPNTMSDGTFYLEAYDSYYSWTSGVVGPFGCFKNFCAWNLENGNIIVLLEDELGNVCFATLKPSGDSYVILQAFDPSYESSVVPTYSYDREWMIGKTQEEISSKYGNCLKSETSGVNDNLVLYYPIYEDSKLLVELKVFINTNGKVSSTMSYASLKG